MPKSRKKAVRVNRPLTAEQQRRLDASPAAAEADKDAIIARGRQVMKQHALATAALRETFQLLSWKNSERRSQGVTLQELEDRTGISRGALSRLENDPAPNPTVRTLQRIANALGKSLVVRLADS